MAADDPREVWERLEARGASGACPVCHGTKWSVLEAKPAWAYGFVCTNCGFVRFHARAVIDEES